MSKKQQKEDIVKESLDRINHSQILNDQKFQEEQLQELKTSQQQQQQQ